jgi:protein pelota
VYKVREDKVHRNVDMRLIKQNIEIKDGAGSATLLPEEPEDMVRPYHSGRETGRLIAF